MSEESGISYGGVTCTVSTSSTEFKVTIGEEFEGWITSKELTIEGLTVGQLNKAYLHGRLERFINSALEKACNKCNDTGWVCEWHPDKEAHKCCGGAGMPCECTKGEK